MIKELSHKGALTKGFNRRKATFFSKYCVKRTRQAPALPWSFFLVLQKNLSFSVQSSFERANFYQKKENDNANTPVLARSFLHLW